MSEILYTAKYLRACAAAYLRYRRRCPLISFERGGWHWERPDVLALTSDRHWLELEIKTDIADLRRDKSKRKWKLNWTARLFYYLVPPDLEEKARAELGPGQGLIGLDQNKPKSYGLHRLKVLVKAKAEKEAPRATLREIVAAVKDQSGTLCGLAREIAELERGG